METISTSSSFFFARACLNRTMQYGNNFKNTKSVKLQLRLNRIMQYGNPLILPALRVYISRLNRTMQYGNDVFLPRRAPRISSLNRTMQYGNFLHSYHFIVCFVFKSYYVVWKQHASMRSQRVSHWFKSYYVVWKLFPVQILRLHSHCLNRTMQYGNLRL